MVVGSRLKGNALLLTAVLLLLPTPPDGACAGKVRARAPKVRCNELMSDAVLVSKARTLLAQSLAAMAVQCLHMVVGRAPAPRETPELLDAWLLLGEAHEDLGEGQNAVLAYGEALRAADALVGTWDVAVAVARRRRGMLLEMSNRAAAQSEYEQGLQRVLTDADLWYQLGNLHLMAGDNSKALHYFTVCCRLNASHSLGREGIGTSSFALGHVRTAILHYTHALTLTPTRDLVKTNLAAALGKMAMDRDSSFLHQATLAYAELRLLHPDNPDFLAKKLILSAQLCDWRSLDDDVGAIEACTRR
jgi:tetratricopeptide (TPR) repeat protein